MRYASVYYCLTFVPVYTGVYKKYTQDFIPVLVDILQNENLILHKLSLNIVTNTKD